MRILITGTCGFVGSTLATRWLASEPGVRIYGLDNLSRPGSEYNRQELKRLGVSFWHGDTRVASDLAQLPAVDWVVHASANPTVSAGVAGGVSSRQLMEHNLLGTLNLLEYCKCHQAGFILLSTSRVYSIAALAAAKVVTRDGAYILEPGQELSPGLSAAGISERFSTAAPISLYGSSKLCSEILALEYGEAFGFPVWINRCGILGGAGQFGRPDQGIFSFWINAWLRGRELRYLGYGGQGLQVRDCLHPGDLFPLLRQQVNSSGAAAERIFNLGGGSANAISLAQLSDWCAERYGAREVAPGEPRQFDVPWQVMDSGLAEKTWGWRPQTPLDALLDEIARHAEAHPHWLELSGLSS